MFDDELSPAQQFNLEKLLGRTAIDRTAVILDIFAQNAHSQEGKAQVQLALYRYRLPRLRGKGRSLSQQIGGIGTRGGPGETQLEIDRRRIQRLIHKLEAELRRDRPPPRDPAQGPLARRRLRHVVIVGYTNAGKSTLLNRLTEAGVLVEDRLFATLDATTRRLQLPGGESVLVTDTVGFVRKLPHQLVQAFASTLDVVNEGDLLVHVVDGSGPDPEGNIDAVRQVVRRDRRRGGARAARVQQGRPLRRRGRSSPSCTPGRSRSPRRTGEGVDELLLRIGDRLRSLVPAGRAVRALRTRRRARRPAPLGRRADRDRRRRRACGSRCASRRPRSAATTSSSSRLARRRRGTVVSAARTPAGFVPPPYPYDRLAPLHDARRRAPRRRRSTCRSARRATRRPRSCSRRSPRRAPSARYPPSIGHPGVPRRGRAAGSTVASACRSTRRPVAACVGSKELVAGLPHWLRLRDPSRDTVLYPEVSYPSYAMGAQLAGCRAVPVPVDEHWRLDLRRDRSRPTRRGRCCLWSNTPGNPAGGLDDLDAVAAWGRAHGVPVFSDECYVEFTWDGPVGPIGHCPGATILSSGLDGVVAVHSLSKRSNLAGLRVGLLRRRRRSWSTTSARSASTPASWFPDRPRPRASPRWATRRTSRSSVSRYRHRLDRMAEVLRCLGLDVTLPGGGFYLWVPAPGGDAWALAEQLAADLGVIVSPGEFYGDAHPGHVRVAVVQPDEQIDLVVERGGLTSTGRPRSGTDAHTGR